MPDPTDLSPFRTMTIVDVDDNTYRLVGEYLERSDALLVEEPDKYKVSHLCAMEPRKVLEMVQQVKSLETEDKDTILEVMADYVAANDNALPPARGLHLVGLFEPDTYNQPSHSWKNPAVLSKKIERVE
jgi:hypothetical protein